MADIFVSYARSDRARVAPIVAALEAQGWTVWWDPAIAPGQEFDRQITAELQGASAVLVVWTPDSVESRWVRGEARDGADRGILVPVRFENAALPIDVRAFHTIDLDGWDQDPARTRLRELLAAMDVLVRSKRREPRTAPKTGTGLTERASTATQGRVTICVLPFSNSGGDPEQQTFCDGITADIITELSRWRRLAVRSRSSSFKYRSGASDIEHVARALDVRYVVEGGVRRLGDRVRINVELIDTETGSQVWAERFDRAQSEVFAVQDRVVQQIVSTLVGRVQVSDVERVRRKPPTSLDAYECVLKGNALTWDDPAGAAEATRLFEQAIELDPGYALAHALLSTMRCHQWRADTTGSNAALDDAYALAKRAVELDDGDSTCHSLLSHACLYRRSYELAMQHARRSVELNPNNAWNHADFGLVLMYVGQADEAMTWFARAKEIDPYFDPPWYWRQAGQALMTLRRYGEALEMFEHIAVRTYRIAAYMAACCARLGDVARAKSYTDECLARLPDFSIRRWMSKEPFKSESDAVELAESLRLAGLPE